MNDLPLWISIIVAILLVIAGVVTFLGSLGLLNLDSFYQRMHAPTMGMTLGVFCIVLAATIMASFLENRPIFHELLITVFLILTAPVTAILLMQSAINRNKRKGK